MPVIEMNALLFEESFSMFAHIQLSALVIGVFAGHAIPFLVTVLLANGIFDAVEGGNLSVGRFYVWLIVFIKVLGAVIGGAVAARLSRHQPLMHGLLTGIVGCLVMDVFREFSIGLLLYSAFAGIVGGWLFNRFNLNR